MIFNASDIVAVYRTSSTGSPARPEWEPTSATHLRARISALSNSQALTANAMGKWEQQVTHVGRIEPAPEVGPITLLRCRGDDRCFLVLQVREANRRDAAGKPDHLIADLSAMVPPPPLPDALTQERRDR